MFRGSDLEPEWMVFVVALIVLLLVPVAIWLIVATFGEPAPGREPIPTEQGEVACDAETWTRGGGQCDPPGPMTPEEEFGSPVFICEATSTAAVDASTPCRELREEDWQ